MASVQQSATVADSGRRKVHENRVFSTRFTSCRNSLLSSLSYKLAMKTRFFKRKDKKLGSKTTIHDLPDDQIIEILGRVQQWKYMSLVCKRWYELDRVVTQDLIVGTNKDDIDPLTSDLLHLTSRYFNLTYLEIFYDLSHRSDGEWQVDDECLRCLSLGCVNLTDISLKCCVLITDVGIANITLCPRLIGVYLENMPGVSERGLLSVVTGCGSMKHLDIRRLEHVRGVEWLEFMGMNREVQSLRILSCGGVNESQLIKLGRRGWQNLHHFSYSGRRFSEGQLPNWRLADPEEMQGCPNLQTLSLHNCHSMSRMGLLLILGQCCALEEVSLDSCSGLKDGDVHVFAENNPQLSSLYLTLDGNPNLTNAGLVHVAENCRGLKSLSLCYGGASVWESGIVAILESCTLLENICFYYVPCQERVMTAIGHLASLRDVDIMGGKHLTDEMVHLMGSRMRKLRLSHCPLLTDECLRTIQASAGVKLDLTIMHCPGITRDAAWDSTGGHVDYF